MQLLWFCRFTVYGRKSCQIQNCSKIAAKCYIAANAECYGNIEKEVIHFVRGNEETIRDEEIFSLHILTVKFSSIWKN